MPQINQTSISKMKVTMGCFHKMYTARCLPQGCQTKITCLGKKPPGDFDANRN